MAKSSRGRRRLASRQCRPTPYLFPTHHRNLTSQICPKKCPTLLEKRDWEDVTCSVCIEYPHNAVLLLCSSHERGCRPYMCGTSFRYSNCLDQYKKAYSKVTSDPISNWVIENSEVTELSCPLCRGQVKGWTVVEPARQYLNAKKRSCMQDNCSFIGTYKELRKHMRIDHPFARPREVDPTLEQKWRRLEREREREDVISTIRSSMPGARVFGDYVIEDDQLGFDTDEEEDVGFDAEDREENEGFDDSFGSNLVNVFLLLRAFESAENAGLNRRLRRSEMHEVGGGARIRRSSPPVGSLDLADHGHQNEGVDGNSNDGTISEEGRTYRRRWRLDIG